MELIYFSLAAIVLYIVSDKIVLTIERKRGERLQNRSVVFFLIIITLSIISFSIIQSLYEKPVSETPQTEQPQNAPATETKSQ